jgi:transposase
LAGAQRRDDPPVLARIDADLLDCALGAWLAGRVRPAGRHRRRAVAVDGKTLRGSAHGRASADDPAAASSTTSYGSCAPARPGVTCPPATALDETCYDWFVRWRQDGTWDRLLAHVQTKSDAVGELEWIVSVDSTSVRAHQQAAGARKRAARGDVKGDRA